MKKWFNNKNQKIGGINVLKKEAVNQGKGRRVIVIRTDEKCHRMEFKTGSFQERIIKRYIGDELIIRRV